MLQPVASSPWPKLRQRFGALVRDVYAEAVCEGAVLISRALPADAPGVPRLHVSCANTLVRMLALAVAAFAKVNHIAGESLCQRTCTLDSRLIAVRDKNCQKQFEGWRPFRVAGGRCTGGLQLCPCKLRERGCGPHPLCQFLICDLILKTVKQN